MSKESFKPISTEKETLVAGKDQKNIQE